MERRLSAIMIADVVGFSRLMRSNEVGTLQALKSHQIELINDKISSHSGNIVKSTGDGFVAEFSSVISATNCAAEIQTEMRQRNANVPQDRRIEFRIGLSAGDILHDDNDVFGDEVNIAARIEALARPGGVAISGATREQLGSKTDLVFEDAGEHLLKNIDRPIQLFHLVLGADGSRSAQPAQARELSVAVLPFTNMSGDPEQEYFADGITEDLITDLSKIPNLFVVGRHSVFAYKGTAGNLVQVARELGVKLVLEGSVRKSGQRVRITAQFIDGGTGGHLWAERYDRELTDIFELQDEITKTIVDQLQLELGSIAESDFSKSPTRNLDAYSFYLQGRQFYHMRTKEMLDRSRRMFEKAVDLDPGFARAYAGIADCDSFSNSWFGEGVSVHDILGMASKAIELEPDLAEAHAAKGFALLSAGRDDEAAVSLQHAIKIDPLCYEPHYYFARYCVVHGKFDQAATHFIRALEIRPDDYRSPLLLDSVLKKTGDDAHRDDYVQLGLKRAENTVAVHPDTSDPLELGAAVLAARGDKERAREWLNRALSIRGESKSDTYNIACIYIGLGNFDKALDILEEVLDATGPDAIQWIKSDPDMDPIRNHPRYVTMMKNLEGKTSI